VTHDPHLLTGAYALDALDDDERAELEAHLATCEDCASEIRGLRATAATLGAAESSPVSPAFHDAVMAQVRATRQLPPVGGASDDDGRVAWLVHRARRTSRAVMGVAAALLLVAAGLGAVAVHEHQQARDAQQVAAQMSAVLAAPDARQVTKGDLARAVVSDSLGEAVFVAGTMPSVDADHVLQLWVLDGGARSVGLIHGRETLLAHGIRPGASFGVTVEPAGGSKQPTTAPIMTMPLA
jgi:anti-sigma-K factor RskA